MDSPTLRQGERRAFEERAAERRAHDAAAPIREPTYPRWNGDEEVGYFSRSTYREFMRTARELIDEMQING